MDMWYFGRICAHARSWHEFAKCRFAHFPSFFSVHVDTYDSHNRHDPAPGLEPCWERLATAIEGQGTMITHNLGPNL